LGDVTGFIGATLTGTVVCTSCGPNPDAIARGISLTPSVEPKSPNPWRITVGEWNYLIPWRWPVQPYPPCPRCTVGELHVEDVEILGMVVQ
jgi:hypothetical protein